MNTLNEYEELKKYEFAGFASRYSQECVDSQSDDKIDIQVYTKLIQLDSRLGTPASEQLDRCLEFTSRSDIIKV